MSEANFDKWAEFAQKAQKPMQQLLELNLKTLQNLSYIRPYEMGEINTPEKLALKQWQIGIENSKKAIDYWQNSFKIMEEAMTAVVQESKKVVD